RSAFVPHSDHKSRVMDALAQRLVQPLNRPVSIRESEPDRTCRNTIATCRASSEAGCFADIGDLRRTFFCPSRGVDLNQGPGGWSKITAPHGRDRPLAFALDAAGLSIIIEVTNTWCN